MRRMALPVAALSLSAVGLIGIASYEGYTERAVIPTAGDVPTVGFGSTVRADGSRVQMGDRTTPVQALKTVQAHLARIEQPFRDSLPGVEMTQASYDTWVDFVYQFGLGNWQKSSMRQELLAGRPEAACEALLMYRFSNGYDCSTVVNGLRNKICWGVWTRQLERRDKCVAALQ